MLNVCTIIARNYLAFARVLADSFFTHHPKGSFTVLVIDDEERLLTPDDGRIVWRRLSDIGLDKREIHRLAGIYDVTELATAVKPVLLRRLLDEGHDHVVYLDPDIRIYASLADLIPLAHRHGIVLTPHTTHPYPRDDKRIDGFFVLAAGVYNLGFVAIGSNARPFLDWWWRLTRREALVDVARMMFTDQRWVDFVPCLFDPFILKDPGYNVAYWNLHARDLSVDGSRYLVNDGIPLRFFHFSGFDVNKPWLLSKHQGDRPRVLLSDRPGLARICREYAASLREAGVDADGVPYRWSTLPSGLALTWRIRRLYRNGLLGSEQTQVSEPPDPFDESDPESFIGWLNSPEEGGPRRLSRYLYSIYKDRPDLQFHFPDIWGADATRFAEWVWRYGVDEEKIPFRLLPMPGAETGVEESRMTLTPGLNIAGYFRAELGIGEAARLLTTAVEAAGIPHSTTTYDATLSRQDHAFTERTTGAHDVNLLCVNADSTPRFASDVGAEFFAGRHNIGYWFWEIERFPSTMFRAFDVVDEVWTATDFVAAAVRSAGLKPVFTVPLPIATRRSTPQVTRLTLGLPERFTFLLLFDFLSVVERKNPLGLIRAFTEAFSTDEGPVLVLKSINGDRALNELERVRAAIADRPDIIVMDGYCSTEETHALVGFCDCYASLHRSEGLGLTMAEAMALGKPVVATGYSGNLHFMNSDNSYLVDYAMCAVPAGCDPYPEGAKWAAPDISQAAGFMREIYERPAVASLKGRRGQLDIFERHGVEASAAAIRKRIEQIRTAKRSRIVVGGPAADALDMAPPHPDKKTGAESLEVVLQHLNQIATPRLSVEGRGFPRIRLAAQRAMFRVTRPYWFQQRQFHTELIAALRQFLDVLDGLRVAEERRAEALEDQLDRLTRKFAVSARELTSVDNRLGSGLGTLQAASGRFHTSASAHLKGLTDALSETKSQLSTLIYKLFAAPYMSSPKQFMEKDEHGVARLGYRSTSAGTGAFYRGFEEIFRGPEALVRDRQRVYLPLLKNRDRVLDVGCGRGEMLDLLREAVIPSVGIDIDADMVSHCREKGHTVEQIDALRFLRNQPEGSLSAVFTAQVIEHLRFDDLKQFLILCRTRLKPGGLLVAETVNPHALEAFKTFYTDLTHQRPIFPEVALALCQLAGFEQAYVMFPLGSGDLDRDRQSQGEYAVVSTAVEP
jgi:glycosyltransferase involved in cell wall biosynthesis/2-polyprenyl-3-methyl-5-hydroxy-6-metoxy-1,4-benzoquinol methylase